MKYIKKFVDSLVHKFLFIKHGKDIGFDLKTLLFTKRKNCNYKSNCNTKLIILDWIVDAIQYDYDLMDWYMNNYDNLDILYNERTYIDWTIGLISESDMDNNVTWKEKCNGDIHCKEKTYLYSIVLGGCENDNN